MDSEKYPNGVPTDYHIWSDEDKGNLSTTFWNSTDGYFTGS